jgi:hypothetical protein
MCNEVHPVRAYRVVTRKERESGGGYEHTYEVEAYTAADAVTQVEVQIKGNFPRERPVSVSPAPSKAPV